VTAGVGAAGAGVGTSAAPVAPSPAPVCGVCGDPLDGRQRRYCGGSCRAEAARVRAVLAPGACPGGRWLGRALSKRTKRRLAALVPSPYARHNADRGGTADTARPTAPKG
jgi:hypothetical protein